jgi:hypothetical protein
MSLHDRTGITAQAAAPLDAGCRLGLARLVIATAQLMRMLDDTISIRVSAAKAAGC